MDPPINSFLLTIFCVLGVGIAFAPRAKLGDPHIIGGKEVDIAEIPYMASLRRFFEYECSASIIGKYYVLTAAHCFMERVATIFYGAAVGSSHINKGAQYFSARRTFSHPNFNTKTTDFDVAVVRVWIGFHFDTKIAPIALPEVGYSLNRNNTLVVSGWGQTSEYSGGPNSKLLKTEVQLIGQSKCQKLYVDEKVALVTDRMFCAGVAEGGRDACQGDSGGPIVDSKSGKQVGIVSWGSGCGNPSKPGVYTKLFNPEVRYFVYKITKK